MVSRPLPATNLPNSQVGAAALTFLLFIIVTAAALLLDKLNSSIRLSVYNPDSHVAMEEARDALIAWAVNHPFNPGTLPMPDRNGDADYDGDADCFNGTINANLLLGKVPWRGMPSPCRDAADLDGLSIFATDRAGEHLWYAVSKNLVYESQDYPFISPGLLNRSSDWITVRDKNGNVISDRVAFVVIAPGPSLFGYSDCDGLSYAGQDRNTTASDVDNYLDEVTISGTTYANYDYDQDFIIYPDSITTTGDSTQEACDQFNDKLVFVTIDDFMKEVSKRVLNETGLALSTYFNTIEDIEGTGALPWLAPFADPKTDPVTLTGQATSASSNLVDTSTDFREWGVTNGDTVWNLTDGSRGTVTAVSVNTLTIGGGLNFGANNTFSIGDEYYVEVRYKSSILMEIATAGSAGNTLQDSGRDFGVLGIAPGDIIENISDGSSSIISEVNGDEIIATGLAGGTDNDFSSGDTYRIRTNTSRVTGTTTNLILTDANVDFIAMGVQVGDIVHNLWDQTISRITSIDSANQLTVDALKLGTGTVFNQNEPYQISRYNGRTNTRIGLLPIHQLGELIPTGFSVEWNAPDNGSSINTSIATDATYAASLASWAGGSSGNSGIITIDEADALCKWLGADVVNCKGMLNDPSASHLSGTATTGTFTSTLVDSAMDFNNLGMKRGDRITNLDDGTTGIIFDVDSGSQLSLVSISGQSAISMDSGEDYQIEQAASTITARAASPSSLYADRLYYSDTSSSEYYIDEDVIEIDDTIENLNGATSIGVITGINTASNYVTHTVLTGGGYADVYTNEYVRIRHDFVDERDYEFDITLKANTAEVYVSGERFRSVCAGYDATCTAVVNDATIKGDGTSAFLTIRDYENGVEVGTTTNVLPSAGLGSSSLNISGLTFYLDEYSGDLPEWFIRNKWHQYIMVAYSDGIIPGGIACIPGTNCLSLNIRDLNSDDGGSTVLDTRDDVRALVMLTYDQLATQSWTNGAVSDYFDDISNQNIADDVFEIPRASDEFDDLLRIFGSCDYPTNASGQLCWSN